MFRGFEEIRRFLKGSLSVYIKKLTEFVSIFAKCVYYLICHDLHPYLKYCLYLKNYLKYC